MLDLATTKPLSQEELLKNMYSHEGSQGCSYADKVLISLENKSEDSCAMSYNNLYSVQGVLDYFQPSENQNFLDLGSGIAAISRLFLKKSNIKKIKITALEFQKKLHQKAEELSNKSEEIKNNITHLNADFLAYNFNNRKFNGIFSILVFLHIINKEELFNKCSSVMEKKGKLYIEDYYAKNQLTQEEKSLLLNVISCERLLSKEEYIVGLEKNGFSEIEFVDMTSNYHNFLKERNSDWKSKEQDNIKLYGQEIFERWSKFVQTTVDLFDKGNLGGCLIKAIKK